MSATSVAFFSEFRAYRSYLSDIFQKNLGMSYAELLPLFFRAVCENTDGFPCKLPVFLKKSCNSVPFPGLRCFRISRLGLHASGIFQSCHEMPSFFQDNILNFLTVVTAVGQNDNFGIFVESDIFNKIQIVKIFRHPVMLSHVCQFVILTEFSREKRNRRQRDYYSVEKQNDICPLMPDHKPLSVIKSLHIFGFKAAPTLYRAVGENGNTPRKRLNFLKNFRINLSLPFREVIQRQLCSLLIIHKKFTESGFTDPRQLGCESQGMLPGFDHQRYQIPQTDKPESFSHRADIAYNKISEYVESHDFPPFSSDNFLSEVGVYKI